jgi:hypothetical protein
MDDIPPCAACAAKWQAAYEADGYLDEEEHCPHRLVVGEFELVKVRWGGSQNPYWAMEEESQSLSEIAETIFTKEHTETMWPRAPGFLSPRTPLSTAGLAGAPTQPVAEHARC